MRILLELKIKTYLDTGTSGECPIKKREKTIQKAISVVPDCNYLKLERMDKNSSPKYS